MWMAAEAQTVVVRKAPEKPTKKLTKSGRPSLQGTSELKINYNVGNLTISVRARQHTLTANEVEEAVKSRIIYRDGEGRRVSGSYTPSPFFRTHFLIDEETGEILFERVNPENVPELEWSKTDPGRRLPLGWVAMNGELYKPVVADKTSVKRLIRMDDGSEEPFEGFMKTHEITITEADLRPSVTYDEWLIEAWKEIFAVGPEQVGLWRICEDLIRRDMVAVVQSWVEREGEKEYHLIVKPHHIADKGEFAMVGARVLKPFELEWLMPVPSPATASQAETARRQVSLLTLVGQKGI
jgi:hypothetical protein